MDAATEIWSRRRIDPMSALMIVMTAAGLLGAAWLRFGPSPAPPPPVVGGLAPPVQVVDLETSEPMVLAGLRGKVVWIVFWSASSASGPACLPALDDVWKRLKVHQRFVFVAAAVEIDQADRVRALISACLSNLPVYLASRETQRRYGVERADPPLHVLIDAAGHIIAIARGAGRPTIERIADQAKRQLVELDPLGDTRFVSSAQAKLGTIRYQPILSHIIVTTNTIFSTLLSRDQDAHCEDSSTRPNGHQGFLQTISKEACRCHLEWSTRLFPSKHERLAIDSAAGGGCPPHPPTPLYVRELASVDPACSCRV